MQKTLPGYINSLTGDNYDILEDIFLHKYRKFMMLYHIISEYAEMIECVGYVDNDDDDILDIKMVVNTVQEAKYVFDKIMTCCKKDIEFARRGNKIFIKVFKKESVS